MGWEEDTRNEGDVNKGKNKVSLRSACVMNCIKADKEKKEEGPVGVLNIWQYLTSHTHIQPYYTDIYNNKKILCAFFV